MLRLTTPSVAQQLRPQLSSAFSAVTWIAALIPVAVLVIGLSALSAHAEGGIPRSERPEDARVYFISPTDGESVTSPVVVRFGLGGMGVAPAGVEKHGTGHHHVVVDAELPSPNLPIPKSDNYRHFGKGQTEVSLDLAPGSHTLQLVLGDHLHMPHDPPVVSERITITVTAATK